MGVRVTRWMGHDRPEATALLRQLRASGRMYSTWSNGPGDVYAAHAHSFHKHLVCVNGSIRFTLPATGEAIDLQAGDELDLPPGIEHAASVGPNGVQCAEAHV